MSASHMALGSALNFKYHCQHLSSEHMVKTAHCRLLAVIVSRGKPLHKFVHLIRFKVQFHKSGSKNCNFDSSPDGPGSRDYLSDWGLRTRVRTPLPREKSTPLRSAFRDYARHGSGSLSNESRECGSNESRVDVTVLQDELRQG